SRRALATLLLPIVCRGAQFGPTLFVVIGAKMAAGGLAKERSRTNSAAISTARSTRPCAQRISIACRVGADTRLAPIWRAPDACNHRYVATTAGVGGSALTGEARHQLSPDFDFHRRS